ncbi:MAG: PqiC family protein [Acetobacteraceae bacterium]|nr:PqiC family protein [Acetobacteraceae bacterium]
MRRMMGRIAWLLLLAAGLGLAGCTSPDPVLFTMRPTPGAPQHIAARVVLLRRPGLPHYLDRTAIVTAMPGYRVEAAGGDRWAEPIGGMFARVLAQDLAQRLPDVTVLSEQGAVSLPANLSVDLEVQDFGPDPSGAVVLQAQVAVERTIGADRTPRPVRSVRLSVRPASASTSDLVAAMSDATGQLADAVAAALP